MPTPDEIAAEREAIYRLFKTFDTDYWSETKIRRQERGREFEALIVRLFRILGLLKKGPYHTKEGKAEQIDGAVFLGERHFLLEAKWVKSGLPASHLFSFLGKVEGKFSGTLGIFISREPLNKNFLKALRLGRRQCVIVIHGEDVDLLLKPDFPVKEYLEAQVEYLAHENIPHLPAKDFLAHRKSPQEQVIEKGAGVADVVREKIRRCVTQEHAINLMEEFAGALDDPARNLAATKIIELRSAIARASRSDEEAWQARNLVAFLREILGRLPNALEPVDRFFFVERVSENFRDENYVPFTELFVPRYVYLAADDKALVEKRLVDQWGLAFGGYEAENEMAIPTRALWQHLPPAVKVALFQYFINIILSDRQTWRPQFKLAKEKIQESQAHEEGRIRIESAFDSVVRDTARGWITSGWTEGEDRAKVAQHLIRRFSPMELYVRNFEGRIGEIVADAQADAPGPAAEATHENPVV